MTTEEKTKELVSKIIELRKAQGLTQKQLGELSGVNQSIIAKIESGKKAPQISTMLKLLAPLGMTLAVVPIKYK